MRLTASNLVAFINQLDKNRLYNYLNPKNSGVIQIQEITLPEGPVRIKRWNPSKGETADTKIEPISSELLWRIANSFLPNQPINFDRVLGGSYNTRSVLESLLAHTPQFHFCYPGRIEQKGSISTVKKGHKHLMWTPDSPHQKGVSKEINTEIVISEIPSMEAFYDGLVLPDSLDLGGLDLDIKRRHAQIQIALYFIGKQFGYRTWIAQNDKGIVYQNKKIGEFEEVIPNLNDEKLMSSYEDAVRAALLIDCIWFKNGTLMPAVMEVEHSTGVTSGLSRMKNFKDKFPPYPTRYVIVAPDEDRDKVYKEANKPQFQDLNSRYFPYSSVEELYALCLKRKLKGVTEEFLDCYMEPILEKAS
ncbi:MAG: restriction endonuclease [Cyclobacteriaceae bacterium]